MKHLKHLLHLDCLKDFPHKSSCGIQVRAEVQMSLAADLRAVTSDRACSPLPTDWIHLCEASVKLGSEITT